jgi:hypothetical protein
VVLDLATEDEYSLNEVCENRVIRETLPTMMRGGSIEIRVRGELLESQLAESLLLADDQWSRPDVTFYATPNGRDHYFGLGSEGSLRCGVGRLPRVICGPQEGWPRPGTVRLERLGVVEPQPWVCSQAVRAPDSYSGRL